MSPACTPTTSQRSEDVALLIYGGLGLFLMAGVGLVLYCLIATSRPPTTQAALVTPQPSPAVASAGTDWHAVLSDLRERVQQPPAFTTLPASPPPRVNLVIDRGVAYLKKQVNRLPPSASAAAPYQVGMAALAGLALLHCGVPPADPAITRISELVRSSCGQLENTYELSTAIWFLDRLGAAQDRPRIRALARQMIAAQTVNGGWGYTCPVLHDDEEVDAHRQPDEQPRRSTDRLHMTVRGRAPEPTRTTPPTPKRQADGPAHYQRGQVLTLQKPGPYDDNSVTQFAILALWVARKYSVAVDQPLALAEARFRALQNADGSWGYNLPNPSRRVDSMTCAGLLALAVGRAVAQARTSDDPALARGLQFLGRGLGHARPVDADWRKQLKHQAAALGPRMGEYFRLIREIHELTERLAAIRLKLSEINKEGRHEQDVLRELVAAHARDGTWSERQQANIKKHAQHLKKLLAEHAEVLQKGKDLQAHGTELTHKVLALYPTGDNFHGTLIAAHSWGDLYFLWSVERMAVVYDLNTIGGQDWYAWGAEIIMAGQQTDGSWADAYPGMPDTSFALLFLKRANVATDLTAMQNLLGKVHDPGAGQTPAAPGARRPEAGPTRQQP